MSNLCGITSTTSETGSADQPSTSQSLQIPVMEPQTIRNGNESNLNKLLLDQERFLPMANVLRIMKSQLPISVKIAKDAKELVQECVSEFILFVASEASAACIEEKRKSISSEDLIEALQRLGFHSYVEPLKLFIHRYRVAQRFNTGSQYVSNESYVQGSVLSNQKYNEFGCADKNMSIRKDGSTYMSHGDANSVQTKHTGDISKASTLITIVDEKSQVIHPEQLNTIPGWNEYYILSDVGDGQNSPVDFQLVDDILPSITRDVCDENSQKQDFLSNNNHLGIHSAAFEKEYTQRHLNG